MLAGCTVTSRPLKLFESTDTFAEVPAAKDLAQSILFDTFTPDFSYESMKGLGTLSGEAMRRAMALGYMKRDNLKETYEELVDREKNLILAIMQKVTHIELAGELSRLELSHDFADPFPEDKGSRISSVSSLYNAGLVSLETAVAMLALTDRPDEEVRRILKEKEEAQVRAQRAAQQAAKDGDSGDDG